MLPGHVTALPTKPTELRISNQLVIAVRASSDLQATVPKLTLALELEARNCCSDYCSDHDRVEGLQCKQSRTLFEALDMQMLTLQVHHVREHTGAAPWQIVQMLHGFSTAIATDSNSEMTVIAVLYQCSHTGQAHLRKRGDTAEMLRCDCRIRRRQPPLQHVPLHPPTHLRYKMLQ